MIAFDLQCSNGHTFEGWFEDNEAYETQVKQGLVTCPICETSNIFKIPSTFGISKSKNNVLPDNRQLALSLKHVNEKIVEFVNKNFEDVGVNFTKEALKMHYGIKEPKNIRGVTSAQEEKILKKEGIDVLKIPNFNHHNNDSDDSNGNTDNEL